MDDDDDNNSNGLRPPETPPPHYDFLLYKYNSVVFLLYTPLPSPPMSDDNDQTEKVPAAREKHLQKKLSPLKN